MGSATACFFPCRLIVVSRLRRPFLSDRFFSLTVNLLPGAQRLADSDLAVLARSLAAVWARQRFLLTAWVLLPDHWHAIVFPPEPLTADPAREAADPKAGSALRPSALPKEIPAIPAVFT
jgi:hypothetical protein